VKYLDKKTKQLNYCRSKDNFKNKHQEQKKEISICEEINLERFYKRKKLSWINIKMKHLKKRKFITTKYK